MSNSAETFQPDEGSEQSFQLDDTLDISDAPSVLHFPSALFECCIKGTLKEEDWINILTLQGYSLSSTEPPFTTDENYSKQIYLGFVKKLAKLCFLIYEVMKRGHWGYRVHWFNDMGLATVIQLMGYPPDVKISYSKIEFEIVREALSYIRLRKFKDIKGSKELESVLIAVFGIVFRHTFNIFDA